MELNRGKTRRVLDAVMGILLCLTLAAPLLGAFAYAEEAWAQGDQQQKQGHYMDFNVTNNLEQDLADDNQQRGNTLLNGGIGLIQGIVRAIMLPAAILLVAWRVIYLAIFPMLAHIDPLDMLSSPRYGGAGKTGRRGGTMTKNDMTAATSKILKGEIKSMIIGLVIVAVVWILIELGIWVAIMVIGTF